MSPLLATTLVVVLWCLVTTTAQPCEPGDRYEIVGNCTSYMLCDKNHHFKLFSCPDGLHFNARMTYCDWPELANCTRSNRNFSRPITLRPWTKNRRNTTEKKPNYRSLVKFITLKNTTVHNGGTENKTSTVEPDTIVKYQSEEPHHIDFKKEIKGDEIIVSATDKGVKKGAAKSTVNDNSKEINGSDTVTTYNTSEKKDKLGVKFGKFKIYENIKTQENATDKHSVVHKSWLSSQTGHHISKRQDKTKHNLKETKEKNEKVIEDEKSLTSNKSSTEYGKIGLNRAEIIKVNNDTAKITHNKKEERFTNKSVINFVKETNSTELNIDDKEVQKEKNNKNNSEFEYVPVNLNYTQDNMGYAISFIDMANTTNNGLPTNESLPIAEGAPTDDLLPPNKSSLQSENKKLITKNVTISKSTSTSEKTHINENVTLSKSTPTTESASTTTYGPTSTSDPKVAKPPVV